MNIAPDTYLDVPVPDSIRAQWTRWEGATWRQNQHRAANNPLPPDQRFSIRPPDGICPAHRQHWLDYRNMHFNPETGNRWPGYDGSPFNPNGHDMGHLREERRAEWDEKASEQMQLIERICLSGRSPQCNRADP